METTVLLRLRADTMQSSFLAKQLHYIGYVQQM